jgi:hypothetical protein
VKPGPPMMNQPPRIFGNLSANGSPIPASLSGPVFSQDDYDDGHDQGDAKRRRIARVGTCTPRHCDWPRANASRHATCAARKRSSAMARCPLAPTA